MSAARAICKQLFGAKYERIVRSLLVSAILFFSLFGADVRITIAPSILSLTATVFSAGIMWQAIGSNRHAETFMGLFMLPFPRAGLTLSYVLSFAAYTLITKALFVLAPLFAVGRWSAAQIVTALLCAVNGCLLAAAWYAMLARKKWPLAATWALSLVAVIFLAPGPLVMAAACAVSIVIALILLTRTDAYVFYCSSHIRQTVNHKSGTASVFVYLLRYLTSNANYLVNTVALCAFACVLPFVLGQFDGFHDMPIGFAILSLNTPICTLISGDPDTEQGLRAMPGQVTRFCTQYCLFIFCVNSLISGVYLICWQLRNDGVGYVELLTAVLFALQSSIFSVALEWVRPLRGWKVETDLWHHPRKYLVPAVMMLIAGPIGLWPIAVWVWLGAMIVEAVSLIAVAQRT